MGKVAFQSLGCKLNQYEVQALREGFLRHGFAEVLPSQAADYYVLNTCTVTGGADKEALKLIRGYHRFSPKTKIIVTGCMATADSKAIEVLPGVARVVPNRGKSRLVSLVLDLPPTSTEESPFFEEGIHYFEDRSRAFVKVQDGCNYFCTFCKIPYVRGRLVSRDRLKILEEVRRLVDVGYQEVVLCGVCLGSFGKDKRTGSSLTRLIEDILNIPGNFRVRLSSIDPRDTPLELVELMDNPKLCPHLHLSLQSGDDAVLKRMRRGYTTADFLSLVTRMRQKVPRLGFSTDLIVGFPGEDEKSFKQTQKFLDEIQFHRVHLFPYSERNGTKARFLDKKVLPEIINQRMRILRAQLKSVTHSLLNSVVGKELQVLVESKKSDGLWQGFSENYMRCVFGGECEKGSLRQVRVRGVQDGHLLTVLNP